MELLGSRTETDGNALTLSSSHLFGQVSHDFGRFGLGAGARSMRDEDVAKTLGWLGSAFVELSAGRIAAKLESRSTDFDDASFTVAGSDLGLAGITSASGSASCRVKSFGYGLEHSIERAKWSFYASGMMFDYSSYDCATTITSTMADAGPGAPGDRSLRVRAPLVARQLAAPAIARFGGYSSSRVPHEAALLKSSVMAGANFPLRSRGTLGFELFHDSEQFVDNKTNTALGYVAFQVTRVMSLDLTLGVTQTDVLDDTLFAGIRMSANLRH